MPIITVRDIKLSYPDDMEKGEAIGHLMWFLSNNKDILVNDAVITETDEFVNVNVGYTRRNDKCTVEKKQIQNQKCSICTKIISGDGLVIANVEGKQAFVHEKCY